MRLVALVTTVIVGGTLFVGCGGDGGEEGSATPQPAPEASTEYPTPRPQDLEQPFTGQPVPARWFGRWQFFGAPELDFDLQFLADDSPECRVITAGRMTCWTIGPRGATTKKEDVFAAGAISVSGDSVVWRMTYNPDPNSPRCFDDDAYRYRATEQRIAFLRDNKEHCNFPAAEAVPAARKRGALAVLVRAE